MKAIKTKLSLIDRMLPWKKSAKPEESAKILNQEITNQIIHGIEELRQQRHEIKETTSKGITTYVIPKTCDISFGYPMKDGLIEITGKYVCSEHLIPCGK